MVAPSTDVPAFNVPVVVLPVTFADASVVAPAFNVPVIPALPFTVRFAFVAGVPTVVAPDCNVPVVVLASVAVPPL